MFNTGTFATSLKLFTIYFPATNYYQEANEWPFGLPMIPPLRNPKHNPTELNQEYFEKHLSIGIITNVLSFSKVPYHKQCRVIKGR